MKTLEEFTQKVRDDSVDKWDRTVNAAHLKLWTGRLLIKQGHSFALNEWATTQFCNKLRIPLTYFQRCPPSLQDENANYWLAQAEKKPWFLRGKGETIRAVLSEKFTPVDNLPLLEALSKTSLTQNLVLQWGHLSETSLHLRMVDEASLQELRLDKDKICAGIHLSNSEVGYRCLRVDALVYRVVCQNGLIAVKERETTLKRRHIGTFDIEQVLTAIPTALSYAQKLLPKVQASSYYGFSEERFQSLLHKLQRHHTWTQAIWARVETTYYQDHEYPGTLLTLMNAITSVAQTQDADTRFEMEQVAGSLLSVLK